MKRTLPVKLDPREVAQRAAELACELHERAVAEEAAASTRKALAKDLEERTNRISRLGRIVHTQREEREVECREEHTATDGTARITREDTGEVIETRPLTAEELRAASQEALPFRPRDRWDVEPTEMEKARDRAKRRAS